MSLQAKSLKEFIALARANPGKLSYASDGTGTTSHVSLELFKMTLGLDLVHVPYKGQGPALIDMLAGRVDVKSSGMLSVLPHIRSGKLRALAVTGETRTEAAPDIPIFRESDVAGWDGTWHGFLAPAMTPKPVVQKLYVEVGKILKLPEIRSRLTGDGVEIIGSTPEEFLKTILLEKEQTMKVIKQAGIRAE
jgi:tripartite-type tricarboxylate transporter receptor subunit TctC